MIFAHDVEASLIETAALVNTATSDAGDSLSEPSELLEFIARYPRTGAVAGTESELAEVRALRSRLAELWKVADREAAVTLLNSLLAGTEPKPFLTRHDGWDWHLHLTSDNAPLAERMAAEAAMAFFELVRTDDWARVRRCSADDCGDVLVDLSRNRSKRYCDDGNCGNRAAVAAYRARKRAV